MAKLIAVPRWIREGFATQSGPETVGFGEWRNCTMDEMKALATEYQKKIRDEAQRKAEEELLKTLPLQEWTELRQLIRVKMVAFNSNMQDAVLSWDSDEPSRVVITRKSDGRTLNGEFDDAASSLHFECAAANIDLSCVIEVRNRVAVYLQEDALATKKPSLTREEITYSLLRDFLIN